MPLAHFRADLLPRYFSVQLFTHHEILLRTIGHRFEMFHPREQQPDDLLVLAHDTHVDRPQRMVFDAPHRIAVIDVRFVRSAIDLRHLIGSKLQRPGRQTDKRQATSTQKHEPYLTHRGESYHRAMFAFLWQDVEKVRQHCSRFAQRLPLPNRVRIASSLAVAFSSILREWFLLVPDL